MHRLYVLLWVVVLFSCKKEKPEHFVELSFKIPFNGGIMDVDKNGYDYTVSSVGYDSIGGFSGYGIYEGDVITVRVKRPTSDSIVKSFPVKWKINWNGPAKEYTQYMNFGAYENTSAVQIVIE